MKIWLRIITLALLVAACGGETGGADGGVITSPDGRATLTLAEDSLPEGTSSDDLSLNVVSIATTEIGAPQMVIQLLPHGLVLRDPAALSFQIPEDAQGSFVVVHQSGDRIEFASGEVEQNASGSSFTTKVDHFSTISFILAPSSFEVSVSLDPTVVSKDTDQTAKVTVVENGQPFSIWLHLTQDDKGSWRLFEFSKPSNHRAPAGGRLNWGFFSPVSPWDVALNEVDLRQGPSGFEVPEVTSTCLAPNRTDVRFLIWFDYTLRLVAKGEPTQRPEFTTVAALFGDDPVPQFGGNQRFLSEFVPGDTIEAKSHSFGKTPTICTAEPSPTTSSSTTSTTAAQERSSSNTSYNVDAEGQPGAVAINSDDCFNDDRPTACTSGIDITGLAWEPVAGAPNQLKVTITFAGPVGGTSDFLLNMGIRGNESNGLGTNYIVEGGEASWNFPGSDGPLPGESVSVDDQRRLVIIRDLSSLTGVIRISIRIRTLTDPQTGDAVQVSNVTSR